MIETRCTVPPVHQYRALSNQICLYRHSVLGNPRERFGHPDCEAVLRLLPLWNLRRPKHFDLTDFTWGSWARKPKCLNGCFLGGVPQQDGIDYPVVLGSRKPHVFGAEIPNSTALKRAATTLVGPSPKIFQGRVS